MLKIEVFVQYVRIGKPHTVKVARCVPFGLEDFGAASSHHLKAAVECFKTRNAGSLSVSDIVYFFPKIGAEPSVRIFFDKIFLKQTGRFRGCPFDRRIPARVKHKSVVHIIKKHAVV